METQRSQSLLDQIGPYLVLATIIFAGVVLFGLGVCVQAISVPVFIEKTK